MSEPTPLSYRCPTCESTSENARNLAVFIDGTTCSRFHLNSNVGKLYDIVSDGNGSELKQHTHYLEGLASYDAASSDLSLLGRTGKQIHSAIGAAFAWNLDRNIKDAYSWLARHYQKGDQIYLFGFCRGAYQVRALAAMIHEVGLVKEMHLEQTEEAYRCYNSLSPVNPETRERAIGFKKNFCWPDVRIHFIGAWHTVSSLGFHKQDVYVTSSASVMNACHLRHALALDERRVKFMPEYFGELNSHRGNIQSSGSAVSDVKEVWFAGTLSDIGGMGRSYGQMSSEPDHHAGNIPLCWMRQEAADNGLVFKSEEFSWCPEDIDLGRSDIGWNWSILEMLPVRHQVSFSGTGKHATRQHLFRPPSVLPGQQIHCSVLSSNVYQLCATLGEHTNITTPSRGVSDGLWTTELLDEGKITRQLISLLSDRRKALGTLNKVLFLLDRRLGNGKPSETIPAPKWLEISIRDESGFDKFALTIVYDAISNSATSEEQVKGARDALSTILSLPDDPSFPRALHGLRFSATHQSLRKRFVAHDEVIEALMLALKQIATSHSKDSFPLIMDCLRYLIDDNDLRDRVVNQLTARLDGAQAGKTRLSLILEVQASEHLLALLRMIVSLARFRPDLCEELKPRIFKLANRETGTVSSAAIEALVALDVPLTSGVGFSNVLGYLSNTLPLLDVEGGSTSSADDSDTLPRVLQVNSSGGLDEGAMCKLLRTIESQDAHQRTLATLTLLKLCRYSIIRELCLKNNVLNVFSRQLESKGTSLLAAYALGTCLKHDMWTPDQFPRAAQLVVAMLDKGWFDNAVGRVEGFDIFGELVTSADLRQRVIDLGIVSVLIRKLERGDRHEIRTSLICLDMLEREYPVELAPFVRQSLTYLQHKDKKTRMKGVNVLSALAQTMVGEVAIMPHVSEIVKMLFPSADSSLSRSQTDGVIVLQNLCNNSALREEIEACPEYHALRNHPTNLLANTCQPTKSTTKIG